MLLQQTRVGAVIPYYVVPTSKSKKSKSTALAEPRRNAAAAAMVEESFIGVGSFLHKDEKYLIPRNGVLRETVVMGGEATGAPSLVGLRTSS